MNALQLGIALAPVDAPQVLRIARRADAADLDLLGLSDHPYAPGYLDTPTLLTWIAAATDRLRVYPGVTSLPLRPPAVLAKAVATLDRLSGGRVELGLGAGGSWDGIAGLGGPRRTPGEAVAALTEAIGVLRALWTGDGPIDLPGTHHPLHAAAPGPAPTRPVPIWLGALGPRMLDLTGRLADGWLVSVPHTPPAALAGGHARIDAAAAAAGRDPAAVRRGYNVPDDLTDPAGLVERLLAFHAEHRMDTLVLSPVGDPLRAAEVFLAEVVPVVQATQRRVPSDGGR